MVAKDLYAKNCKKSLWLEKVKAEIDGKEI